MDTDALHPIEDVPESVADALEVGAGPTASPLSARGTYQLLPPLTRDERAQLEASILAHGVEDPIDIDEDGVTLDGHHRREIAERLGIPYETRTVVGLSAADKRLYAIRRNTERRQLTKAQRALVGLRAEPVYRAEAKARQGQRTDLLPDSAKHDQHRMWASEEASRLVGLRYSTYRSYRSLIIEARKERGAAATDEAIETGAWDIPELRALTQARRKRDRPDPEAALAATIQEVSEVSERLRRALTPTPEERAEQVRQARSAVHVLPPPPPAAGETDADVSVTDAAALPDPVPRDPHPAHVTYESPRARLRPEDASYLHQFRRSRLGWRLQRTDPQALGRLVVADWSPSVIADLRDGARTLATWLTELDTALGEAQLGTDGPVPGDIEATQTDKGRDDEHGVAT